MEEEPKRENFTVKNKKTAKMIRILLPAQHHVPREITSLRESRPSCVNDSVLGFILCVQCLTFGYLERFTFGLSISDLSIFGSYVSNSSWLTRPSCKSPLPFTRSMKQTVRGTIFSSLFAFSSFIQFLFFCCDCRCTAAVMISQRGLGTMGSCEPSYNSRDTDMEVKEPPYSSNVASIILSTSLQLSITSSRTNYRAAARTVYGYGPYKWPIFLRYGTAMGPILTAVFCL